MARGGKGKCFPRAVQKFTISPWLPEQSYITSTKYKKKNRQETERKKEGWERKEGGGRESRWCHAFHSKRKKTSRSSQHTNITHFSEMPRRWATATTQSSDFQQMWQTGLIWHREGEEEKRKEGGDVGQNSTSGFYQTKTDVESAAAAAAFKPRLACYESWITISGQPF